MKLTFPFPSVINETGVKSLIEDEDPSIVFSIKEITMVLLAKGVEL